MACMRAEMPLPSRAAARLGSCSSKARNRSALPCCTTTSTSSLAPTLDLPTCAGELSMHFGPAGTQALRGGQLSTKVQKGTSAGCSRKVVECGWLRFDADVADAADEVVAHLLAFFHGHDFDGIGLVVRAQDEVIAGDFDILHGAIAILDDGVHVELALAIGLKGVVVTINENRGAGKQARIHAHAFAAIGADDDETLPVLAVAAFDFGTHLAQEGLLELLDLAHVHAHDEGLEGGNGSIDLQDIFELVLAGGKNTGALVDFGGVEQVENREVLDVQNFVHTLQAEASFAIEEIGDVGLFEAGLLRQTKAGEVAGFNTIPQGFAQIILQGSESHGRSIPRVYSRWILQR